MELSVIIPAYNEADAIGPLLADLCGQIEGCPQLRGHSEVIVVDDGSADSTGAIAARAHPLVRLVRHPYNMGNGAAVKSGIRQARGRVLLFLDADGQHDPSQIPRFYAACGEYDMVVGARDRRSQAGVHRRLANALYNQLATYVAGRPVLDLTSGYRAVRREVARRFVGLLPNGFSYPTTLTLCLLRAGFSVHYLPIRAARRRGKSKIRVVADGTRFLLVIAKICMLFSPLRIFLPVSLYLFLMGLGYYGFTFWTAHRFTNMSMLLFTTAVTIFMMGLLAEQIALTRFERTEGTEGGE